MDGMPEEKQAYDFEDVNVKGHSWDTHPTSERALLVGIERPASAWTLESSLAELERLAHTAGAEVVAKTSQKLNKPHPKTFVGSGKAQEIAELASHYGVDVIIFDDELTPSQQANLEKAVSKDIKVIDRTALILDIFALHAKTKEGRLQVRLAQNQYLYPRLRGMWAHLASNRMGGGVGSRFGEGESQLEVDRRIVRNRITAIKKELATLSKVRKQQRESRYTSSVFKVSLVGYTNAGKSSLLNRLCCAEVYSDDLLFATLDSTTRKLALPEGREVTLTDTVGFIQKLPTTLIEAFKSTLDEIRGSDLILHVIDVSSEDYLNQIDSVNQVLNQINVDTIPKMMIFNKCDLLESDMLCALRLRYHDAYFISAHTGYGIDHLIQAIGDAASSSDKVLDVLIPFERGELVSLAHRRAYVVSESFTDEGIHLVVRIPSSLASKFEEFQVAG